INALLKMDAIDTASADSFGSDQQITRAQVAKTVAIVLGLRIDKMVTTSSFSDVKWDDPARIYIEALKNSALTYDVVDKFNLSGGMSRQELAMLLIKGLGLDEKVKAATPSKDETVDDTYKSYVAYALQQKIIANPVDGKFGGSVAVTKKEFALAAYMAMQLHLTTEKPAKASIAEVKLIGTGKVTVRLNREVDINKAILSVTKYGSDTAMSSSTEWSDDNMIATIETDVLTYGKYTIALSGLDAGSIDKGEIEFLSEVGKIQKLEIVTSTEKLPKSKVMIEFKATNEYGENVILAASDLNIMVGALNRKVDFYPDKNAFVIDLSKEFIDSTVMVTLLEKRSFKTASKTFKVGDFPIVSKIVVGELKIPGGQLIFKAGVRAYLAFKAYDQYGFPVVDPEILNMGIHKSFTGSMGNIINQTGGNDFIDFDNDGFPEMQMEANTDLDGDKEVIVNLFSAGEPVSTTINVTALKTPATVVIKPLTEPAAEGDGEKLFGLTIKDSTGYEFSTSEIVEAETTGRISVYASGGIVLEADTLTRKDPVTGAERNVAIRSTDGQIRVKSVIAAGPATINVRMNALNETVTLPINIEKPRKPNSITLDDTSMSITLFNGIAPTVKFVIKDQYDIEYSSNQTDYKVEMKLEKVSGDKGAIDKTASTGGVVLSDANPKLLKDINQIVGKPITVTPHTTLKGSYRLTASLVQVDTSLQTLETLDSLSVALNVIDPKKVDLIYEIDPGSTSQLGTGRMLYDSGRTKSVTDATYLFTNYSVFTKSLNINVKDSSGYKVSLSAPIKAVTFSVPNVIGYSRTDGKLVGLDNGKATVTVYIDSPFGLKKISAEIGVTADPMIVSELKTANASPKTVTNGATTDLNGMYIWNSNLMGRLQAVTNYATFTNQPSSSSPGGNQDQITPYNDILNVQVFISDVVYKENVTSKDTISVDPDFKIVYSRKGAQNNIKQFTIYVVGGNQLKAFIVSLQ
ncbi:S-layer homology domain-containing protein, partial [Paenibacillus sp. TAF58]